jgi:hypothetical protein
MFGRKTREIKELNSLLMKMCDESTNQRIENYNLKRDLAKATEDRLEKDRENVELRREMERIRLREIEARNARKQHMQARIEDLAMLACDKIEDRLKNAPTDSIDFQTICDSLSAVAQTVRDMDMFPVPPAFPVSPPVSRITPPTWSL